MTGRVVALTAALVGASGSLGLMLYAARHLQSLLLTAPADRKTLTLNSSRAIRARARVRKDLKLSRARTVVIAS